MVVSVTLLVFFFHTFICHVHPNGTWIGVFFFCTCFYAISWYSHYPILKRKLEQYFVFGHGQTFWQDINGSGTSSSSYPLRTYHVSRYIEGVEELLFVQYELLSYNFGSYQYRLCQYAYENSVLHSIQTKYHKTQIKRFCWTFVHQNILKLSACVSVVCSATITG